MCCLQTTEVYSKLYYGDRICHVVRERLGDSGYNAQRQIQVIREVTQELHSGEDDEIKAIVATKVAAAAETSEGRNDEPEAIRTPEEYQE
jgi:hypothetical protein